MGDTLHSAADTLHEGARSPILPGAQSARAAWQQFLPSVTSCTARIPSCAAVCDALHSEYALCGVRDPRMMRYFNMAATNSTHTAPRWMRNVLLAAGAYNILWGAFVVLFPSAIFVWLGMAVPNYPQLWQCIGMIVGVYGLGYAIAAMDPARHWPIVLVGLLGKVFGPLGMVQALWTGALPWGFALNCVTNDLIWWLPFALILRYAWEQHRTASDVEGLPDEATLLAEARTTHGSSLAELSRSHPVLVVFLRHAGCTFCREALADISARRAEIERDGTKIVLVHLGTPEAFAEFAGGYGLGDVAAVADPERRLYRGLGLRRGTLSQLLGWRVWMRGAQVFFSGHRVGKMVGDGTQMPGVFLLRDGRVVRRFLHATAADRPDYTELCQLPAAK